jgi:hypothetical protein
MNNLKRRDFLKLAGIAAIAPTALLKAEPKALTHPVDILLDLGMPDGKLMREMREYCDEPVYKAEPLSKKFGTTSMNLDGASELEVDSNIVGNDATCVISSNEKEEIIELWDFSNREWTIHYDPLSINFVKFLDKNHYMTISRNTTKG